MPAKCKVILLVTLLGLVSGCPSGPAGPPGPEAVLAGIWTGTAEDGSRLWLGFDDRGMPTRLAILSGDLPPLSVVLDATTVLDGSTVTVSIPAPEGDPVTYTAELAEDQTTMTGVISRSFTVTEGGLSLTVVPGQLTLTRLDL